MNMATCPPSVAEARSLRADQCGPEFQDALSQILAQAERGEDVVIARDGKPVARLVPVQAVPERPVGFVAGSVPAAFFERLPADELGAWT